MRFLLLALGGIAACGGQVLEAGQGLEATPGGLAEQADCASGTIEGIDVSYWQGSIDWSAVRASGRRFAFIRVADGFFEDPQFESYWAGAKAAGLYRGAYHFFRPDKDAVAQADLFVSKVGALGKGDLPAALDIEVTGGQTAATIVSKMRTWLDRVEAGTGKRPVIYSSPGFWPTLGNPDLSANPIWVANWYVSCPSLPAHYTTWQFWQYSAKGAVAGISGDVDLDRFNGSLKQLMQYAGAGSGGHGVLGAGSPIVGGVAATANADGRLEVFVRGADDRVWTDFQNVPNGDWSGWFAMGGNVRSTPITGKNADGRIEVFARGSDNALWHSWQNAPNGSFSAWYSLGGSIEGDVAVGSNQDGRLEVFVRGSDGAIYHDWQNSSGWSAWYKLGTTPTGGLSDPAAVRAADGRLYVFARDSGGAVWFVRQVAPGSSWTQWKSLAGVTQGTPAAGVNQDGRIEVFARGGDGALWHNWQDSAGGSFGGWSSLGGDASEPSVASNADGRLEVFVRGADANLYRIAQEAPNAGWDTWTGAGIAATTHPAVTVNQDGRLEAFARASDGTLAHVWQETPGSF